MQFEMNGHGYHRIIAPDGIKGDWATYRNFSMLTWQGCLYIAATAYHSGTPLCETVFRVERIVTELLIENLFEGPGYPEEQTCCPGCGETQGNCKSLSDCYDLALGHPSIYI